VAEIPLERNGSNRQAFPHSSAFLRPSHQTRERPQGFASDRSHGDRRGAGHESEEGARLVPVSSMSFSYGEERRGNRVLDVLTNEDTGLRIIVSRLGAELISLARLRAADDWLGYLHRDN